MSSSSSPCSSSSQGSVSPKTPSLSPRPVKRTRPSPKVEPQKRKRNPKLSFRSVVQRILKLNLVVRAFRDRLLWRQAYNEWSLATPTCVYSLTGDTPLDYYKLRKAQMRARNEKLVADWKWEYELPARMAKFDALRASMRK